MAGKENIKELAVAAWRLEKWLDNTSVERKMAAKSALRSIKKYIADMDVEIKDPAGAKFDPGLAVEVINNEDEAAPEEDLIIVETISPYIYQNGKLLQHAKVIIGARRSGDDSSTGCMYQAVTKATDETAGEAADEATDEATDEIAVEAADKAATYPETDLEVKCINNDATDTAAGNTNAVDEKEFVITNQEIERMMAYAKIL